jgi:hypothetical protein
VVVASSCASIDFSWNDYDVMVKNEKVIGDW